ncbi:MAG: Gfo/Idh/MocA family oxidoreductase, partial [bacterium]
KRKLTAGIIGYGYMGNIRRNIIEQNPHLELSYIVDQDIRALAKKNHFNCRLYTSYKDSIKAQTDLVFVCTPNVYSPEIVCEYLSHGKHVFCEKPPGRNLRDIQMIRGVEKKNPSQKLMFGFNHRYHPGIMEAKGIIDGGRFGNIMFVKGTYGKSGGKDYLKSWRNNRDIAGGGILLDQGIHMLDLFRLFCGNFEEVKSFISKLFWDTQIEDNAFVYLRNKKGQIASLHSSATLWRHTFKIELFLEKAYLIISGLLSKTGSYGRETLVIGRRQFEDEAFALGNPREEVVYFDQDLSWAIEVQTFVQYILEDKKVLNSSSEDALKVMELIEKIYQDDNVQYGGH